MGAHAHAILYAQQQEIEMTFEQLIGTAKRYDDKGMYEVADIYWNKAADMFCNMEF